MNTPILVNSEIKTAKYLRDYNVCYSFPYNDINSLSELIDKLILDKDLLNIKKRNLNRLVQSIKYYEDQAIPLLKKINSV